MDPMMPDLSGLSEEERKILEEVFARQKAEEQKEEKLSAAADKELEDIEKQIGQRKETAQRLVGTQDDAICQICQKTKFADGIGHKCFYCQLRSCARCGGRTTSKNKNIWACSLCQKRQQILAKTGKWFQNPTDQKGSGSQPGSQHDLASQQYPQGQLQTSPSQQPLIMTNGGPPSSNYGPPNGHASTSAYDSHNMPNGQPSMMMPAQQQQQQNHLPSTSQGGGMANGVMPSQRQMQPPIQQQQQPVQQQSQPLQKTADSVVGGLMGMIGLKSSSSSQPPPQQPQQQKPIPQQQPQQQFQQQQQQPIAPLNGSVAAQQQQLQQQSQQPLHQQNAQTARRQNTLHRQPSLTERDYDRRQQQQQQQQSRYDDPQTAAATAESSSSNRRAIEDEKRRRGDPYMDSPRGSIRSTEFDDRRGGGGPPRKISQTQRRGGGPDDRSSQQIYEDDPSFQKQQRRAPPPHVDAQRSPDARSSRSRDPRNNGIRRQPSKSSDPQQQAQSAAPVYPPAVPPPEKPIGFSTPTTLKPLPSNQTRHRKSKLQSRTSMKEGTSSEEDASPRGNTESADKAADFTEKDLLLYIYGAQKAKMGPEMAKFDASLKSKSNLDLATTSRSSILPGNSLAAKIRQYLSSPVSWQPSADQRNLIGHMVLQRLKNDSGDLGLKVAGGRSTANGRLGAFVTKVRPGSVADIVGQLRPGDEVLEWNGHCLQNASLEHVRQIVTASKNDSQIELIVSRSMSMPGGDDFLNIRRSATGFSDYPDYRLSYENTITIDPTTGMRHSQTHTRPFLSARGVGEISPLAQQQQQQLNQPITYNIPRARNVSAGPSRQKFSVPDMPFSMSQQQLISRQHSPLAMQAAINAAGTGQTGVSQAQIFGTIEIALLYLPQERELIVNVLGALDLPPRRDGALRNPYAKLFLLPDRSEKSIRQTTVLAETISPQWNESFYYRNLTEPILMSRVLEVTVWDYDKYEANAFLGEVLIDFSTVLLDNQPFSYTLMEMDDENPVRLRLRNRRFSSCTPPPRPYSEMAHYKSPHLRKPRGHDGYRARIDDDYDTGEYDYGLQHIPRSRTYDRAGIVGGGGQQNSCYNCGGGSGTADWNINSSQNPQGAASNGYISDTYATQMSSRYYSQRPHSATAIRKDPLLEGDGSPHSQRYRTRPRHRHSQDPSYRMSPLNSPYGPPDEPQPIRQKQSSRRYEPPPMDPAAPLPPQHQQSQSQLPQQPLPLLPPHMQSYSNGEYGSDGSETMSVNSAQSMQNRQIIRQQQQQQQQSHHHQQNQQQQQLPFSSEDGEGSSNSLRHQSYVNDDYGQNISMEEATQSDTTMKSGAQALKEMKERKKSLMTRLIPGRGAGAGIEKRTGFARSEEVGVPDSLLMPMGGGTNFQKQASKESTDSEKYDWPHQAATMNDTAFGTFIEDLGKGQIVGRQVLASPVLGEIQLTFNISKFGINVTIDRGKNLTIRANVNNTPAPYVKLYLMEGKVCVCKAKTQPSRKTTAPVFQQAVEFQENFKHRTLQITVLGDCGRMERKLFMGIAQINLDKVAALPQPVQSWYKLFHNSSLTGLAPIRKDSENSLLGGQQQQQQLQ